MSGTHSSRRGWLLRALGLAPIALTGLRLRGAMAQPPPEQLVKVTARRFQYEPNLLHVKAGVPIAIEFTSIDFVHGFHLPDANVRADLVPGKTTVVKVPALAPGTYDFLCDNFCGDGHETMHGRIVAQA